MGGFAAGYGEATGRLGERSELLAFRISIFSSILSVIVGTLWLVLTATGSGSEVRFHNFYVDLSDYLLIGNLHYFISGCIFMSKDIVVQT